MGPNGGELVTPAGIMEAGMDANPIPRSLPPRSHPSLRPCNASVTGANTWVMDDPFPGMICDAATKKQCFNVQDCKTPIVLWEPVPSCGDNKSMHFAVNEKGHLVTSLHPGMCVGPDPTGDLSVRNTCPGAWTFDAASGHLAYADSDRAETTGHSATGALCATAEPADPSGRTPEVMR